MNNVYSEFISQVKLALENVVGKPPVKLHEPSFTGRESEYLLECLNTRYVSSAGEFVTKFEREFANYVGASYAIATVNGTAALHLALLGAGVQPDEEVLIPALSFVATANAVRYCGAIPNFVDSQKKTLGLDPWKLREYLENISLPINGQCQNKLTRRTIRAIVPMHTFGHPVEMEELVKVAQEFNLSIVEDAAESVGSLYKNIHTGNFGKLGIFSFNGNKTITTGGGGIVITNDASLAEKVRHLSSTSKIAHPYEYIHDKLGFNYRMPNINAALGCAQLEKIDQKIDAKRKLYKRFSFSFRQIDRVDIFREPVNCKSNYWLQALMLGDDISEYQSQIILDLNKIGYQVRPPWKLLSELNYFIKSPSMDLSTAKYLTKKIINIPSSPNI